MTDNVNRLAANLTTQVRAIAEVATAVTKGDLSRSIDVEAAGRWRLKDNINEMIFNLRDTTEKNTAQDWLKTNLAKFTRLLQGQRDLITVSRTILSELAPLVSMQHGVFYLNDSPNGEPDLKLLASYAYTERKHLANRFKAGEVVGRLLEKEHPADQRPARLRQDQFRPRRGQADEHRGHAGAVRGRGQGGDRAGVVLPLQRHPPTFLAQLTEGIGIVLNTITATMRTEELLKQSQSLAVELQTRQQELTETNARLEARARTLQASEERLKQQQEELQQTNEELEERPSSW